MRKRRLRQRQACSDRLSFLHQHRHDNLRKSIVPFPL